MSAPVAAFDLATKAGWAVWIDGKVYSGWIKLGKVGDTWGRLRAAIDWLSGESSPLRHVAWGVGDVAFERPLTFAKGRAASSMFAAHELKTSLLAQCLSWGVPPEQVADYAVSTIKKHATGNGRAKKPEVVEAMAARWDLPELVDDNEADALAALSLHLDWRAS